MKSGALSDFGLAFSHIWLNKLSSKIILCAAPPTLQLSSQTHHNTDLPRSLHIVLRPPEMMKAHHVVTNLFLT